MTPEERFQKIEELHAEQIELAKQDRMAHIAWKRDMESQVQATWKAIERAGERIERMAEENAKGFRESQRRFDEGMAEMRKEMAARDQTWEQRVEARDVVMDKRVGDLVIAIGQLIQRMDGKAEPKQ
jgi:hypothetical protein